MYSNTIIIKAKCGKKRQKKIHSRRESEYMPNVYSPVQLAHEVALSRISGSSFAPSKFSSTSRPRRDVTIVFASRRCLGCAADRATTVHAVPSFRNTAEQAAAGTERTSVRATSNQSATCQMSRPASGRTGDRSRAKSAPDRRRGSRFPRSGSVRLGSEFGIRYSLLGSDQPALPERVFSNHVLAASLFFFVSVATSSSVWRWSSAAGRYPSMTGKPSGDVAMRNCWATRMRNGAASNVRRSCIIYRLHICYLALSLHAYMCSHVYIYIFIIIMCFLICSCRS